MHLPIFFSENQFIESIPITDRAIHYGDGLFETLAVENHIPQFFQAHLDRLELGCRILKIHPIDMKAIEIEANSFLNKIPQGKLVLKIIVTRGSGGRGYSAPDIMKPRIIFACYPWPEQYEHYQKAGVKVFLCQTPVSHNKCLAGVKHLNRLEQVLARLEFNTNEYQEGLLFDDNGDLIEGTMSNVFIYKDKKLLTPKLDQCGVLGIMRQMILRTTTKLEIRCEETVITQDVLFAAEEVFLCNSLIKIWPVIKIMQQTFGIGKITNQLINAIDKRI